MHACQRKLARDRVEDGKLVVKAADWDQYHIHVRRTFLSAHPCL